MASFGLTSATVIPQSNFRASGSSTGEFTASQDFTVLNDYINTFAFKTYFSEGRTARELDSTIPSFFDFLSLTHVDIGREDGGWTTITANFTGNYQANSELGNDTEPVKTYTLTGSIEEASITEHPKFVQLSNEIREKLNDILQGRAQWDAANAKIGIADEESGAFRNWTSQPITGGDALEFANLIAAGWTTYKRPVYTWVESWTDNEQFTSAQLNSLGYITSPGGGPPTPSGERDFMLVDIQSVQNGTTRPTFNKSLSYLLSDRGGHNSFLYSS